MIDTSKKIRAIVNEEPLFGEFLKEKGFPLKLNSPITLIVSFDDVAKKKDIDKAAFLAEYATWKKIGKILKMFEIKQNFYFRSDII